MLSAAHAVNLGESLSQISVEAEFEVALRCPENPSGHDRPPKGLAACSRVSLIRGMTLTSEQRCALM